MVVCLALVSFYRAKGKVNSCHDEQQPVNKKTFANNKPYPRTARASRTRGIATFAWLSLSLAEQSGDPQNQREWIVAQVESWEVSSPQLMTITDQVENWSLCSWQQFTCLSVCINLLR
jgi:hypothetical protein